MSLLVDSETKNNIYIYIYLGTYHNACVSGAELKGALAGKPKFLNAFRSLDRRQCVVWTIKSIAETTFRT